ncbi:MAG: M20/M25/M40 family metallo-hydrolase [Acidimicrobiales bacterium]
MHRPGPHVTGGTISGQEGTGPGGAPTAGGSPAAGPAAGGPLTPDLLLPQGLHLTSYLESASEAITARLLEYLRVPSISSDPAHAPDVRHSAELTASMMRSAGMAARVIETGGLPAAYGEWLGAGPAAPTALVYGHHDVQPVEPLDAWDNPPFDPVIEGGECRGRGAIDDKGQVSYQIEAVRGVMETEGGLPVNVKMLVEGEEESGSPTLERLLEDQRDLLACDVVVVSDTGMWDEATPSMCMGMRGLAGYEVELTTAERDLHSGSFGGPTRNPAHLLATIVSDLHLPSGRVALPGFYDRVRELSDDERRSFEQLGLDEELFKRQSGAFCVGGEEGRSIVERIWSRPTCDVVGISSGHAGPGLKTIIPATATAKVTFRLVADQRPDEVRHALESFVAERAPAGCRVRITGHGGVAAAVTDPASFGVASVSRAIELAFGNAPLLTREGGSGPEEALGRVLGVPLVYLGVGLPADRIHAPNERMVMAQYWKGLLAAGELWHALAVEAAAAEAEAGPAAGSFRA